MSDVARAAPDGYSLIAAGLGPVVANGYLYKQLDFDPQHDFAPISLMEILPSVSGRASFARREFRRPS